MEIDVGFMAEYHCDLGIISARERGWVELSEGLNGFLVVFTRMIISVSAVASGLRPWLGGLLRHNARHTLDFHFIISFRLVIYCTSSITPTPPPPPATGSANELLIKIYEKQCKVPIS
jgi:hypothetical protein